MKHLFLPIFWLTWGMTQLPIGSCFGQNLQERVFLHTDKSFYLSGETLWFSAYCVTAASREYSKLSSVLYVELLDQAGTPIFQEKIRLKNGRASGQLFIEAQLNTQTCYLRAYTAWMRNYGAGTFFEKALPILNPFQAGGESIHLSPPFPQPELPLANQLAISLPDNEFELRKPVEVQLQAPHDPETWQGARISVSVYKFIPQLDQPGNALFSYLAQPPTSDGTIPADTLTPELYAPIIHGRVMVPQKIDQINISIAGEAPQLFAVPVGEDGRFFAEISPRIESNDLLFWSADFSPLEGQIRIESPFAPPEIVQVATGPQIDSAVLPLLESYALNTQIANAYLPHSTIRGIDAPLGRLRQPFYGEADVEYDMENYLRFPLVDEVFYEIVTFVNRKKKKQEVYLWDLYANEQSIANSLYFDVPALVMVDGIPVQDLNFVWNMSALKLHKIHLIQRRYLLGQNRFPGLVHLLTYKHNFAGAKLPPHIHTHPYQGFQVPKIFHAPAYPSAEAQASRIPDFRNVLYWQPDLLLDEQGQATFSFFTGDDTGIYCIEINGLSPGGQTLYGRLKFEVNSTP